MMSQRTKRIKMKKEMVIPNKINELNEKLNIKSDKYDGNVDVRTWIRASIDPKASKTVIVIGLNPSLANADKTDRTFTKIGRCLAHYDVKKR